ncbi:MAG TPA: DMT family transporter [Acidimicrobiia bacterium]|jgi:drug/metabolite transporter (DMT)-like permease
MTTDLALAIAFALTSALLFATSNVVEQRIAARAPEEESLRPQLLVTLARQPVWLAGFAADVGGYGAQAAALAFGALLVVAPLGALGLLFSLLLDASVNGRRLFRSDLAAAVLLCAGLSVFLAVGAPSEGSASVSAASWAPALVILAAVVAVASLTRRHVRGPARATLFGLASGMTFGINAALTKVVVHQLGQEPLSVFWHWELYGVAVLSVSGLIMVQSALQAGSLAAALPSMEVAEPVVATIVGVVILGEHLHAHGNGDRVVIAAAALAMLIGLFALARSRAAHSPPSPAVDQAMTRV